MEENNLIIPKDILMLFAIIIICLFVGFSVGCFYWDMKTKDIVNSQQTEIEELKYEINYMEDKNE